MGPSDKLQSNYGRYRRGKCQPRNCVDNWLTDCNKQCGGDRGNSCLILLISGYCLCRHFCFFHSDCHRLQKKQWVRCRQTASCALHTSYCTHLHNRTTAQLHTATTASGKRPNHTICIGCACNFLEWDYWGVWSIPKAFLAAHPNWHGQNNRKIRPKFPPKKDRVLNLGNIPKNCVKKVEG